MCIAACLLLAGRAQSTLAQSAAAPESAVLPHPTETMVVLGSAVPVPLAESPVSVVVLPVEGKTLLLESPQDLLRQDSSVDLQERGAGGGQADIVLRGGTFEQALVLLNGFRINDSQTSHHNLDLPIPLDAMNSIEVLHGAGSTLQGADALSGVVDFLTAAPSASSLRLRAGAGSFGENEESLLGSLVRSRWSSRLTAERNFSTGFLAAPSYVGNSFIVKMTAITAMKTPPPKAGLVRVWESPTYSSRRATGPLAPTSFMAPITPGSGPKVGLPPDARS